MSVASAILKEINGRSWVSGNRKTKAKIADETGLSYARVNAIMNLESQGTTHISLSEIRIILHYASQCAAATKDHALQLSILERCDELRRSLQACLGITDELYFAEQVLAGYANLDPRVQERFSQEHSGIYIVIRFDRDGKLALTRMDVFEKKPEHKICRFLTRGQNARISSVSERFVDGFIYRLEDHVYTIGKIRGTGAIRNAIMQPMPNQDGDMVGLRLGLSSLDGGPSAYRMYCKKVGGAQSLLAQDDNRRWDPFLKYIDYSGATKDALRAIIPDIEDIVALLGEPESLFSPWGLRIPRGTAG